MPEQLFPLLFTPAPVAIDRSELVLNAAAESEER